jgi:hypothetical protein
VVDTETFLTILYVAADDFVKTGGQQDSHPGPAPSLCASEVLALGILAQWARFPSECDFYRYAHKHLRCAFPRLPKLSQFNRLLRHHQPALAAFAVHLAELLGAQQSPYEALDGMALEVRDRRRRGSGWLAGQATIGYSNRLGWYEGFYLLTACTAQGVVTGFGLGPAASNDRQLAETLFALRLRPDPRLPSAGLPASGPYLADKGFAGHQWQGHWWAEYGVRTLCLPQANSHPHWPQALRRWQVSLRQIVETVHAKFAQAWRLRRERPHCLGGLLARLSAMMALHNFCIWLNRQLGRPNLAFADLLDW